jgi:hypothetical protein
VVIESVNTVRSRVILVLIHAMQIQHSDHRQLNIRMRTLTYVIWMLTLILIVLGTLVGCSTLNTTVENGIGQIPGQRVHVTTTVYRW